LAWWLEGLAVDTQSGVSASDRRVATKNTWIVVLVSRVRLNHAIARKELVSETAYWGYGISDFGMLCVMIDEGFLGTRLTMQLEMRI
jgi:hypothetical protein